MHKINSLIVSLLVCFMCLSCGSDPSDDIEVKDPISYSFSIDKQTINVNSSAQEENISVNTNGKWNVSCDASWITVSPTTGTNSSSVKVSIAENATPEDRNATLVFMSVPLEKTYTIKINQAAKQFTFSVDKDSISATSEAYTEVISITTNDEWSISSDVDWISMSKKSGKGDAKIEVYISKQSSTNPRSGNITITGEKSKKSINIYVSQEAIPYRGYENGHEWVDLGLPSGTLWATCNIGADKPEDFGKYFSWGDTIGYRLEEHHSFSIETYKYYDIKKGVYTKYTNLDSLVLEIQDDAANANWGGTWRMPSDEEIRELIKYCDRFYAGAINGVDGCFIYKRDNIDVHIFFPYAGVCLGDSYNENTKAYWFNFASTPQYGHVYRFVGYIDYTSSALSRYTGLPIRAVCNPNKENNNYSKH